jgi:hypothetical protein
MKWSKATDEKRLAVCHFTDQLPPEIRLMIYKLVLDSLYPYGLYRGLAISVKDLTVKESTPWLMQDEAKPSDMAYLLSGIERRVHTTPRHGFSLLQLCRLTFEEVLPLLYERTEFVITRQHSNPMWRLLARSNQHISLPMHTDASHVRVRFDLVRDVSCYIINEEREVEAYHASVMRVAKMMERRADFKIRNYRCLITWYGCGKNDDERREYGDRLRALDWNLEKRRVEMLRAPPHLLNAMFVMKEDS